MQTHSVIPGAAGHHTKDSPGTYISKREETSKCKLHVVAVITKSCDYGSDLTQLDGLLLTRILCVGWRWRWVNVGWGGAADGCDAGSLTESSRCSLPSESCAALAGHWTHQKTCRERRRGRRMEKVSSDMPACKHKDILYMNVDEKKLDINSMPVFKVWSEDVVSLI